MQFYIYHNIHHRYMVGIHTWKHNTFTTTGYWDKAYTNSDCDI